MRKIMQIVVGMYSDIDPEKDFDEQRFAIIILCDDNTIWQHKEGKGWENIDASEITNHIKPKPGKR